MMGEPNIRQALFRLNDDTSLNSHGSLPPVDLRHLLLVHALRPSIGNAIPPCPVRVRARYGTRGVRTAGAICYY